MKKQESRDRIVKATKNKTISRAGRKAFMKSMDKFNGFVKSR